FSSAEAFLASLPDTSLSCVITDVRMPDMSGIELIRRLKELKVDVPVVVITGHGDVALAVEAMKLGATDFFEKPFNDDLLLASVRAALAGPSHKALCRTRRDRTAPCQAVGTRERRAYRLDRGPRQQTDRLRSRH